MRVLLFNDNPVVTKLVTLSAQKTGDELEVCSDLESVKSNEVDLLIVDDGLYNDESALGLGISVTASQHLFMANRGNEKPEGFEHIINKPFLPTDLVEFFTMISNSLESVSDDSNDALDMQISMDDDSLELENFDDELTLEAPEMEDELDLGTLDLDELEPQSDMLIDLDDTLELKTDEDESTPEEIQESVLDKDDLAEVQSLLEDEVESEEDDISVGDLDDLDDLGLEIDEDVLEGIEEESDELLSEDEDLGLDDIEDDISEESFEEEPSIEDEEFSLEDEKQEEELSLDDISEDELLDLDIAEESESEILDDDALTNLEDEIQSAVSELSDEELDESVDEDILLDIANNNESLATFSGLDDLDEQSLKVAVGEADASDIVEDTFKDDIVHENNELESTNKSTKVEGVEALKTLLKALENDDVVNSLKGMNININISFGGDE